MMFDLIRSIKGPDFLVIYFIYCLIITIFFKFITSAMSRSGKPLPNDDLDSYQIAVLKSKNVIHTLAQNIIFKLYAEKYLDMNASKRSKSFIALDKPTEELNWIENSVLGYFYKSKTYNSMISNRKMIEDLKLFAENIRKDLAFKGLMKSEKHLKREKTIRTIAYIVLLSLGVTKLMMGFMNNKPITYLILELIFMSAVFFVVNKISYLTHEGNEYLRAKRAQYSWVKNGTGNSGFSSGIDDAVMGAALFGVASMFIYPEFGALSRSLDMNLSSYASSIGPSSNNGCSSYTGCSSFGCSSSGCSSSGCGGSSCGGGGCGGCGGCGGD